MAKKSGKSCGSSKEYHSTMKAGGGMKTPKIGGMKMAGDSRSKKSTRGIAPQKGY